MNVTVGLGEIVYAFDNRVPSPQADTEQVVSNAAALSRRGLRLTLLLPRLGEELSAERIQAFYRVSGRFDVAYYPLVRGIRPLQKAWAAVRIARHPRVRTAGLLYTRNLPVAAAALAAGARVVLESYRPWPDQHPHLRPLLRRMTRAGNFVGAILHSRLARDSFTRAGTPEAALLVAHNGYDPSRMEPVLSRERARAGLGLPAERPIAVYMGRIDPDKGLDAVAEAADRCPEVLFLLVGARGSGDYERALGARANLELVPWQRYEAIPSFLYAADVLLVPTSSAPLARHGRTVLPMKLFGYLAAGRPIVAPNLPDMREILADGRNALLVPPDDPEATAGAIRRALEDAGLRDRIVAGAAASARKLTWDARAERIHGFLLERLRRLDGGGTRRAAS